MPVAGSFRSSWQSMVASLNADLESSGKEGAAADETEAAAEGMTTKAARGNSATVIPASQISSERPRLENSKPIAPSAGKMNLSLAGTRSGIAVSRTAIGALPQSTANSALKSGAKLRAQAKEETADNSQTVSSAKSAKPEAVSGDAVAANFVTAQSISLPIPAPVIEVQPSSTMEAPPQTPLTDLPNELSYAFTSSSIQSASSFPGGLATAAGGTIAAGNQAAGPLKTAAEEKGAQSPHSYDSVTSTAAKSATSSKAEEVEAINPAPQGKSSTAHAQTAQAAGHSSAQNRNIEEVKSSDPNGLGAHVAGEELSSPGRVRSQAENTAHTLADSQPGLQAQPAIQGVNAVATPVGSVAIDQSSAVSNAAASQSAPVLDTAPSTGKAGPAGSSKTTSVQAGSRISHAAAAGHGNRQDQAVPAVQDGANDAALSRDLSAVRSAVNLGGESAGAASKDGTTVQDTFAALDAESSSGTTTWVHAGTRSAEAGFQDPALGWVGVRADASGGGVHASLVPGSAEAAVTLGGHLAGLNSYLAEQHTPVDSITLAAPEDRSAHSGMGQGAQQSMDQDRNQGAGQDMGQQSGTQASAPVLTGAASREVSAISGRTETIAQAFIPGGTHISVMA